MNESFNVNRHICPETENIEIGVDTGNGNSMSVAFLVDRETLLEIYWNSIPANKKRKIPIGDKHEQKAISNKST